MARWISESSARKTLGIEYGKPGYECCDSCHDDDDLGYGMCEQGDGSPDEYTISCCCRMPRLTPEQWAVVVEAHERG